MSGETFRPFEARGYTVRRTWTLGKAIAIGLPIGILLGLLAVLIV
jgi:hypothetical protein